MVILIALSVKPAFSPGVCPPGRGLDGRAVPRGRIDAPGGKVTARRPA